MMTAFLLGAAACSDSNTGSQSHASDGGSNRAGGDAGQVDAGRRHKQRFVSIDLYRVATRQVTADAQGKPAYGPMQPLDGADVCIVKRRKAFDVYKPFAPVDPPICTKSAARQVVHLDGAPAESDLVITIAYEGLLPAALTARTGDDDVPASGLAMTFSMVLLKADALAPWVAPRPLARPNDGLVAIRDITAWGGTEPASHEVLRSGAASLWGGDPDGEGTAGGLWVYVTRASGPDFEITTADPSELSFVSLPEGSARMRVENDNPRKRCGSLGGGEFHGLPADPDGTLEIPVLAGHVHLYGFECGCANGPGDGELLDLAACTFAPGNEVDAGG